MEWMEEEELLRSRLRGGARGSGYGHLCEENKNCRTLTTLFCKKKHIFSMLRSVSGIKTWAKIERYIHL